MGDGGILPFLVILFVFWVLEGIAKAKRRGQLPDAPPPFEEEGSPGDPRLDRESELLLELAKVARRAPGTERAPERAQRSDARPTPPPVAAAPSGWDEGAQREVALGRLYTALPPARSAGRSSEELRPAAAAVALAPAPARALDVPREVRLARPSLRESRLAEASAPRTVRAPVGQLDVRRLSGATPAELRRLIVLQEVLGPPVALRDDPSGREFD